MRSCLRRGVRILPDDEAQAERDGSVSSSPLWSASIQQERLAELTADTEDSRKELPPQARYTFPRNFVWQSAC